MLIAETFVKEHYNILKGFRKIYGINKYSIFKFCNEFGLNYNSIILNIMLNKNIMLQINDYININFKYGNDLKELKAMNINRLQFINCYRGRRHSSNLPVHGQRTHTNAKTCRKIK